MPQRILGFNISAKKIAIYNYPFKSNFLLTCSFSSVWIVIFLVIFIFKSSNPSTICKYFLMAFTIDGPLNRHIFQFVIFLFDLPLILGKLQALVLGETTSNAWLNTWLVVTSSFTLENIRVWCYCVFWIMLGWSSKFTIWRWSKWKPWSTSQWPRGRRNTCYIACFMFFMIFFSFMWFCLNIISKCVTPHWGMLHWFCLVLPSNHLRP